MKDAVAASKARGEGKLGRWHLGVSVDPLRQPLDATTPAKAFKDNPGQCSRRCMPPALTASTTSSVRSAL